MNFPTTIKTMKQISIIIVLFSLLISCSKKQYNFLNKELSLIKTADNNKPMRVLKINNKEDSIVLRSKSSDIILGKDTRDLKLFVDRLFSTVRDSMSMGVGIAAPQVGVLKNIIWVQRFDKDDFPFEVYLNPKIIKYTDKKQDCVEGCLSIPNRSDKTTDRAYAILIEYDTLDGDHKYEMIEAFTAVIFQHEIDHLNGILYLDHLEKEMKEANK